MKVLSRDSRDTSKFVLMNLPNGAASNSETRASGKHSVLYALSEGSKIVDVWLKTKVTRASCRRRAGTQ